VLIVAHALSDGGQDRELIAAPHPAVPRSCVSARRVLD